MMVFQGLDQLFPWLTALDNVAFALRVTKTAHGIAKSRALAREYISLVGLTRYEDFYSHQLSGGMKQRAALARGLVTGSRILLLDEPFAALDAITRCRLQADLRKIVAAEHKTVVFVTHDIEEAVFLADRILVMQPNPGRVRLDLAVTLTHPRVRSESAFVEHKRKIFDTFFEGMERSVEYVI